MDVDDFKVTLAEVQRAVAARPAPTVDRFHINSDREKEALREHVEVRSRTVERYALPIFGIPIVVNEQTPPGVLRAMLKGEVVEDIPIR